MRERYDDCKMVFPSMVWIVGNIILCWICLLGNAGKVMESITAIWGIGGFAFLILHKFK